MWFVLRDNIMSALCMMLENVDGRVEQEMECIVW